MQLFYFLAKEPFGRIQVIFWYFHVLMLSYLVIKLTEESWGRSDHSASQREDRSDCSRWETQSVKQQKKQTKQLSLIIIGVTAH